MSKVKSGHGSGGIGPKTPKTQEQMAIRVAEQFMLNFNGINSPTSLSYNDNYCGAWLTEQINRFGYKTWEAMAADCRVILKGVKPAPKPRGQKIRIEVVKYMGKFGSFANHESEMYQAILVGANGKRQALPDTRVCCTGYEGHPERKYAVQRAKIWAALLNCPTVFVDTLSKKAVS